jgi:glucose-1-phosphate cytidylyltransferase
LQVVILCGGRGTRLGQESEIRPKPLVEIGGKPILWHIMKHYARYGHKEFILCLGYKGEMIKEYFLNYEYMENDITVELGGKPKVTHHSTHSEDGWKVTLANTGLESATGTRVKKIEKFIKGDTFMLTYGDGVSDINLDKLLKFHHSHGKVATITAVHPPARFGELDIVDGHVSVFSEKPQTSAGGINGGFQVYNRRMFEYLTDDDKCALEHKPLQDLVKDNELMAYEHEGFWQCMDTVRELTILRDLWDSGQAPWKTW